MTPLLVATQVGFRRAGEAVFAPLDLSLEVGQTVVVLGPNGCGKTTLLRLLAGILRPSEGHLERAAPAAFLGHLPAVKADLNCRENLGFVQRFHGGDGLSPGQALARLGLAGFGLRPARTLSAGQKRRLGLAGLLVARRPIWLLDEPYASLDDDGAALVDELLDEQRRQGGIVLSTHQRRPPVDGGVREFRLPPPADAGR
jgi:heme exporter protein A